MTTAQTYNTGTGPCFTIVNTLTVVFKTRDVNQKLLSVIEGREIRPKLKQTNSNGFESSFFVQLSEVHLGDVRCDTFPNNRDLRRLINSFPFSEIFHSYDDCDQPSSRKYY